VKGNESWGKHENFGTFWRVKQKQRGVLSLNHLKLRRLTAIFCMVKLQAPPRAEVVKNLQNGIIINLLGMGLTLLGLQATIGGLVAKSLTSSAGPYLQGTAAGYSPVLALDVFLVQVFTCFLSNFFIYLCNYVLISIE
jgi:hypothetical protein